MVRMTQVIRLSPALPEIQRINPSHLGVLCLRFAWGLHPRGAPDIPSSAFRPSSLRPDAAVPVLSIYFCSICIFFLQGPPAALAA